MDKHAMTDVRVLDREIEHEVLESNPWLRLLLRALELYDGGETAQHSWRVARGMAILGDRLEWPIGTWMIGVRAALEHDIGKLFIPRTITAKPAALSPEEWREMRRHPRLGFMLLADIDPDGAMVLVAHHECAYFPQRGKNYPRGDERRRPSSRRLAARSAAADRRSAERRQDDTAWQPIRTALAIADHVDALMSDRVYHRGQSSYDARFVLVDRFPNALMQIEMLLGQRSFLHEPVPSFSLAATGRVMTVAPPLARVG